MISIGKQLGDEPLLNADILTRWNIMLPFRLFTSCQEENRTRKLIHFNLWGYISSGVRCHHVAISTINYHHCLPHYSLIIIIIIIIFDSGHSPHIHKIHNSSRRVCTCKHLILIKRMTKMNCLGNVYAFLSVSSLVTAWGICQHHTIETGNDWRRFESGFIVVHFSIESKIYLHLVSLFCNFPASKHN